MVLSGYVVQGLFQASKVELFMGRPIRLDPPGSKTDGLGQRFFKKS